MGYSVSFDSDLDTFSSSIALTKSCVATILEDKGTASAYSSLYPFPLTPVIDVVLELDGRDIESELLGPLQKLLGQCKSVKVLSKYVLSLFRGFLDASTQTRLSKEIDETIR